MSAIFKTNCLKASLVAVSLLFLQVVSAQGSFSALDQALEENKKLPEDDRFIRIYIGQKNTQLYLAITNAAGKKQTKRGGLFASSKGADHGFGLSRVESIVKKYGGHFSADSEDGGFTAEILIPLA